MIPFFNNGHRIFSMHIDPSDKELHVFSSYADDIEDVDTEVTVDEDGLDALITCATAISNARKLGIQIEQLYRYHGYVGVPHEMGLLVLAFTEHTFRDDQGTALPIKIRAAYAGEVMLCRPEFIKPWGGVV